MYDILIRNGLLIDGSGKPGYSGDLAVQDGKIAAIGDLAHREARRVIDAAGRCVTPGFWDIHRHGDAALFRPGFGRLELAQGLTTIVNGNCGLPVAPAPKARRAEICAYLYPVVGSLPAEVDTETMASYLDAVDKIGLPLNVGMLAGGGTLRAAVAGYAPQPLNGAQLDELHRRLRECLDAGVLGVSLGLGYAPECFYSTEELIAALLPLQDSGVVLTVHMRQEGAGVVEALEEMLQVARALRTPVHISHMKGMGKANWGKALPQMLDRIAKAREEGLDVSCDVYPYTAGSTQLVHVLPPECQNGGLAELSVRLTQPEFRARLKERMQTGSDFENIVRLCGWENVLVTTAALPQHQSYLGRSIAQLAREQEKDPYDLCFDLLAAEQCQVAMIDFYASDEDVCAALQAPFSGVISDSTYPDSGRLHPRVYGSFARLLEQYVKEKKVLTLEQAVHKLTMQAADRFGVGSKGRLEVGCDADINIFSPDRIHEPGTYLDPAQLAQGMDEVLVGGVSAISKGQFTDLSGGKLLRGNFRR